ncbi:telomere length regulation protein-domain-containing protein [Fennellomyces sp. T-0311]|nr:telomere length regulation protein-domain-containing protein [Fennellomyces sp. T-0311]
MNEQLRALDDATLPENTPDLDAIRACVEQPLEWARSIRPVAWKQHIRTIAQIVIPNWAYAISSLRAALKDTMLHAPKVSLPIILDCLHHSNATALELYIDLLKRLTADPALYCDDRFFCNMLCSVPTRIANALGLGGTDSWYIDKNYFARLSRQVARNPQQSYTGELLGRVIRQGHADVSIAALYPIVLEQGGKGWPEIWTLAESYSSSGKITETFLRLVQKQDCSIQNAASQLATILFADGKSVRVENFLSHAYLRLANASWTDATTLRIAMTTAIYATEGITARLDHTPLSTESFSMIDKLIRYLIDKWADPVFLKHGSYREQEYITSGLVYAVGYLSSDQIDSIMNETALRGFIHRWFENTDMMRTKLAVVVAESLSQLTEEGDSQLSFGILNDQEDLKYLEIKKLATKRDALTEVNIESACDNVPGPIIEEYHSPQSSDQDQDDEELDPDALITGDQDSDDDDESDLEPYPMEEESDDDTMQGGSDVGVRKKRVKAPVYILDLINYLKDDEDPIKLDIGLSSAEQLIRQKTNVGAELRESAVELARRLIGFPKAYDLDNTSERQKLALATLVAAVPETVAGYMIDQIFDRNASMEQKQTILASIILGVRELAGITTPDDDGVLKDLDKWSAIEEPSAATTTLGKSRVFSRRMDVEKKKKTQRNRLSGLAGPVFFFPLLVGWWEGARGRARSWLGRDALLAERFIMTLNVIMHCATNTPDKGRIVTEYFEFALPLRFLDLPRAVTRAILLGFDIIVNVSYSQQGLLLLQEYAQPLAETKKWLEDIMERVNEDELKQIALRTLAKLMEISMSS